MFKKLKNQKGFTLLESILAATIISVGIWGAMLVTQNAQVTGVYSDKVTIATQLANEKLEEIIADKSLKSSGYSGITETNYSAETLSGNFSGYERSVTITEVSDADLSTPTTGSGLKKVTVTVSFDGQDVSLVTVLANYS